MPWRYVQDAHTRVRFARDLEQRPDENDAFAEGRLGPLPVYVFELVVLLSAYEAGGHGLIERLECARGHTYGR